MLFTTNDVWETKLPDAEKLESPGARHFSVIELSFNFNLLHVDVEVEDGNGAEITSRFLFGSADDAIPALTGICPNKIKISVQCRRCDTSFGEYEMHAVKEIIRAKDRFGQKSFLFVCRGGKRILDGAAENEAELSDKQTIYSHIN